MKYDVIYTNVPLYSKKNRLVGEIDILAFRDGYYDIFEVKCSFRLSKAKRQLRKIKKIISSIDTRVNNLFFFCGESGTLTEVY